MVVLTVTNWLTVEQTRKAVTIYFVGTLNCTAARTEIVVLRPIPNWSIFEQIVKKCEAVRTASAGALNATTQMEEVLSMYVTTWSTSELQILKKCESLVDFTGNRNAYNQSRMVSNDTMENFGTFTYFMYKLFEHKREVIQLQLLYTAAILQFDVGILNGIHKGKVSQKTLTNAQMLKKWEINHDLARPYNDFCINNPWLNVSQEGVRIGEALDTHYIITAIYFCNNAGVVIAVLSIW